MMRIIRLDISRLAAVAALAAWSTFPALVCAQNHAAKKSQAACSNDSGLKLPAGFCASIFADGIGHARHLVVTERGVVYVNTWSGEYYGGEKPRPDGFLVALEDKGGSGKADFVEHFGETARTGGAGGTGIGIYKGAIYAEINDRIIRYTVPAGAVIPQGAPETIVSGLPLGGDHPMHPFIIADDGSLYIDVGSATNSCQPQNRQANVPGANPCVELETRAGIWRYDANKTNQKFSPAGRYATGIRNGEGFAIDSGGRIFVTQHGRDQLYANWGKFYQPSEEATQPAEQMMLLKSGGDYGWPECYYDGIQRKLVLAPEYGGDGGKRVGICASKTAPVAAFPAHWGPNGMTRYDKKQFPARYREGVFIAFHGSWDRAPYSQGGYNVVFQPIEGERSGGACEIFADGFAGPVKTPEGAVHRPSGVAAGPDGALYVSDDIRGRIYRIVYDGPAGAEPHGTPCPSASAPAGPIVEAQGKPPEGTNADAGASAVPVPPGATPELVALGDRVFHGQAGGATCTGCHGQDGGGSPLGPDLASNKWLWSDGSFQGILKAIKAGVAHPKKYRSPMPPYGGTKLTDEQASAVAAYVWSISHRSGSK